MKRTALVHDWLTGMRGGEKVLEACCKLFPEAPIYTLFHFPGSVGGPIEERQIHTSFLQRLPGVERHYRYFLPLFPRAIERFDLSDYDLVVSTSHCVAKGVIPASGARHICYCHTPMRYAWDQETVYFPKRTGPTAAVRRRLLARLRRWDVATADRVGQFLANSSFVSDRIRKYYHRDSIVLHPPVDTDAFTPSDTAERTYALVVTALAPYKRVELAVRACRDLDLELRIVGNGPERSQLESFAGPKTRFLGRVDENELVELYRGALCFVQPGIEDFGISTVEALACGTPVVALGKGGVLDIVRDGREGVLYDSEDDSAELAEAIDKIRQIRFNSMDLTRRAQNFSSQRFIEKLETLIQRAGLLGDNKL